MKKIIAFVLSFMMIATMLPAVAFAEPDEGLGEGPATENEAATPVQVMDNIAAKYAKNGVATDDNAPWLAADMAAYLSLYPDTKNRLSEKQIQDCVDAFADAADKAVSAESPKASEIAKYIIAFRALGYDPEKIITSDFRTINLIEKLKSLIDSDDTGLTSIYALPYVIIAMQQDESYLSDEQKNKLISSAITQKTSWQNMEYGPDAAAPMLLALEPYYDTNAEVKTAVDEAVTLIKQAQNSDGTMGYTYEGQSYISASSMGLVIAGFSSLGLDSEQVLASQAGDSAEGNLQVEDPAPSLIDGLMTQVNNDSDGFLPDYNSFSTEQGFRGLVAWQLLKQNKNKRIYDFSANPKNIAQASWADYCPVTFEIIPEGATVEIEGQTQVSSGKYDLQAGEYDYTISKDGYVTSTGKVSVTEAEAANHTSKTIKVSLAGKGSSSSSKVNVTVRIMAHDEEQCSDSYTYKSNASSYEELANETVTLSSGQTVFDATCSVLDSKGINYVEKTYGYISKIGDLAEFDHGANSGWMFMVNGTVANKGCRDVTIKKNSTVTWFYTDDYTKESGSEKWSGKSSSKKSTSNNTENTDTAGKTDTGSTGTENAGGSETKVPFTDVNSHWAADPIKTVYEKGLMNGISETSFEPDMNLSRGMLVTILYRYDQSKDKQAGTAAAADLSFDDVRSDAYYAKAVAWAAANKIVSGYDEDTFAPNDMITREQMATILYRYEQLCGGGFSGAWMMNLEYSDKDEISEYAYEPLCWCTMNKIISGKENNVLDPKGKATRAETAAIITRYMEK